MIVGQTHDSTINLTLCFFIKLALCLVPPNRAQTACAPLGPGILQLILARSIVPTRPKPGLQGMDHLNDHRPPPPDLSQTSGPKQRNKSNRPYSAGDGRSSWVSRKRMITQYSTFWRSTA
ncbi:hypothetical protein DFH94DRAFT_199362 [Russula ochroleuca]|uniref:Secreted protein n=1 Tax=Russula ochroleuca TaxID=152965 RepID=A0A9P5JZA1_9AGAM|nr:hypothetical protein DFH94DRAFT_199362 [Russula ochroleuca]